MVKHSERLHRIADLTRKCRLNMIKEIVGDNRIITSVVAKSLQQSYDDDEFVQLVVKFPDQYPLYKFVNGMLYKDDHKGRSRLFVPTSCKIT